ncbi:hypothetical protein N0V84_006098 [Fusarium piperis]|uniref:Uncharacterized protein n=1 Tax=Fusarium piperis TaxID=1435070 RepID=A0A9W9BPM4_9HYPO|nr:hypothetical protein N0V84_006098 [Fusarium piperis]
MTPSKDVGAVPPSFDPAALVTNPRTTQTITEDAPAPVSFLDNLDISAFDVSNIDFSEMPDAFLPGEHASMGDTVPMTDNFPWFSGIQAGETSQPGPNVENNLFPDEASSLWPVLPVPGEGDFSAFGVPYLEPLDVELMDLDIASNAPLPPTEPTLGEVQPRFNQPNALGVFEPMLDQHFGFHLPGK